MGKLGFLITRFTVSVWKWTFCFSFDFCQVTIAGATDGQVGSQYRQ